MEAQSYANVYDQAWPMPMMNLQAPMFRQGLVAVCNQLMGMSRLGTLIYLGQANKTAKEGFRPEPEKGSQLT